MPERFVIGSEENDERKVELDSNGGKVTLPVSLYNSSGSQLDSFPVTGSISVGGHSSVGTGKLTIDTAGTAQQLASDQECKRVHIRALSTNTGMIAIGDSNVSASDEQGVLLFATQTLTLDVGNLNLIYIDASVSGEGVSYLYEG